MNSYQTGSIKNRKLLVFTVAALLLATLIWYISNNVSLQELIEQESRFRTNITHDPWRSFFIGFGVYLALALVPGTGGKAIVYGWLFGFWQALIIVSIGLTIAAMAIFSLSRYLFQESIQLRHSGFISNMNQHLKKEAVFYLLTLRLAHAPYSIVNPVSGASQVSSWTFFWTTLVGLFPANAIWAYVGINLPSLQELALKGPNALINMQLFLALVACATLPLVSRWLIRYFKEPDSAKGDHDAKHESQRKPL